MRSKFTPIYTFFACLSSVFLMISFSSGQGNDYAGHPNDIGTCANCHGGGTTDGSVMLEGIPSNIISGETYNLRLVINDIDQVAGGFQVLAALDETDKTNLGTFTPTTGESKLAGSGRIIQSQRKSISNGSVSWDIPWTANFGNTSPETIKFYYVGNAVNGGGTGGDAVYAGTSEKIAVGAGLAVDFLNFTTQNTTTGIRLNWSVSNENQTDFYIIERSTNGKEFSQIATQTVATSTNQYQFIDTDLVKNQTYYYRIQEVATGGKTTFSTIETATYRTLAAEVIAYPNPATTDAAVQVKLPANFAGTIQLVNVQGQVVYTQKIATQLAELVLPTSNVAAGVYQLILQDGSEVYQQKLVIR